MKNAATLVYRLAIALAIAALVAVAQYWLWQSFNRGSEFIGTSQSIKGFAYSGYQRDQSPLRGTYPTEADLGNDLDLLARRTLALGLEPLVATGEVPCQDREGALTALREQPVETFDFHHDRAVTAHWTKGVSQNLGLNRLRKTSMPLYRV